MTQTTPTDVEGDPTLLVAGSFDDQTGADLLTVNESTAFNGGSGASGGGASGAAPSNQRYMRVLPIDDPNAIPACLGDVGPQAGGNGVVNIDDLVLVITHWGAPGNDQADVNHDHIVNIDDLVALITNWGPCP